jgi:hypothetical protein
MIDLHERLSEFSYGYGVTRDVEQLLAGVGIRTVPFMPSLLQEKRIGFDVGFGDRGVPLLLQFKLGQSLSRFVRSDKTRAAPALIRPFFRFSINTGEPDGQFETLLKVEIDGAEVYYVAPRFTDWPQYVQFFDSGEVLERSVMVTPREVRQALVAKCLMALTVSSTIGTVLTSAQSRSRSGTSDQNLSLKASLLGFMPTRQI